MRGCSGSRPGWIVHVLPEVSCWQLPLDELSLAPSTLHLWRFSLSTNRPLSELLTLLSKDERQRAERLRDPIKAEQFIIARHALRSILSRYLDLNRSELRFIYNPQGKPELDPQQSTRLQFNLSHSCDLAVLAVCFDHAVGIDLEWVDPQLEHRQLAERFFTDKERQQLAQTAPLRIRRSFYRLWTAKEARLKQRGHGFWNQESSASAQLSELFVHSVAIGKNFVCTFALEQAPEQVFKFSPEKISR